MALPPKIVSSGMFLSTLVCLLQLAGCSSNSSGSDTPSIAAAQTSNTSSASSSVASSAASSSNSSSSAASSISSSANQAAATGTLGFSSGAYSAPQSSGLITITVNRSNGSSGVATVHFNTADGTAAAGVDYTSSSGTLSWTNGDSTAKSFQISINSSSAFAGSKTINVVLTSATGSLLGSLSSALVSINGSQCSENSNSWVTTGIYDWQAYGNYVVNNNNWGGLAGQQIWANNESCWGVTTSATTERGGVGSYPTVTRGWATAAVPQLSTTGTNDWTTKSGMGIAVTQLTKAKATWAFTAPTAKTSDLLDPPRWMALMDVYFHKTPTPGPYEWPPFLDLMINQALADQAVGTSTFYALVASMSNASTVTLGGIQYLVYIDQNGEDTFHQAGGHNIHLFQLPTQFTSLIGTIWGNQNKTTTDIASIISFFRQANPKDDLGLPLKNAAGVIISSPLITSDLYLTAINAGWEIDVGTQFTNSNFCVAMQNEPDCP